MVQVLFVPVAVVVAEGVGLQLGLGVPGLDLGLGNAKRRRLRKSWIVSWMRICVKMRMWVKGLYQSLMRLVLRTLQLRVTSKWTEMLRWLEVSLKVFARVAPCS